MLFDLECHAERTILKEFEQGVLCPRVTPEQMDGLCEHRLANEERGFKFFDALGNPAGGVVPIGRKRRRAGPYQR
ncbi:MAG TPA: hypothetical protein VGP86_11845 [Xanthobacteraceae bacterium]|jgi:hypothetical protein|nr:hypothetical protein [Xanthobacteraceae bacterium]